MYHCTKSKLVKEKIREAEDILIERHHSPSLINVVIYKAEAINTTKIKSRLPYILTYNSVNIEASKIIPLKHNAKPRRV